MTECIGCGCTDQSPCEGGCSWLACFDDGTGVCSSCPEVLEQIQADDAAYVNATRPSGLILPGDPEFDIRAARRS